MFNKYKKSKIFLLSIHRIFFTAYSVDVEYFYHILGRRGIFFTAYSVDVEYFYQKLSKGGIILKICHPALLWTQ